MYQRVLFLVFLSLVWGDIVYTPQGGCQHSASLCRCLWARMYGFTEGAPFDGLHVELYFDGEYNATELNETVAILGPELVVEFYSCEERRREKQREKEKEEEDIMDWKTRMESLNVEKLCLDAKKEIEERNKQKWFWQKPETLERENTECPSWYHRENRHYCVEWACLQYGKPKKLFEIHGIAGPRGISCVDDPACLPGPPGPFYFGCRNKIKIKR